MGDPANWYFDKKPMTPGEIIDAHPNDEYYNHKSWKPREKDNNTFSCYLCNIQCTGQASLDSHMVGQKHKKMVREYQKKQKEGTADELVVFPGGKVLDGDELVKLSEAPPPSVEIDDIKEPVIGLEYIEKVVAVADDEDKTETHRFYCHVCDVVFDDRNKVEHLIGTKHRTRTIKRRNHALGTLITGHCKKRSALTAMLTKVAASIEKKEGRGKLTVISEGEFQSRISKEINLKSKGPDDSGGDGDVPRSNNLMNYWNAEKDTNEQGNVAETKTSKKSDLLNATSDVILAKLDRKNDGALKEVVTEFFGAGKVKAVFSEKRKPNKPPPPALTFPANIQTLPIETVSNGIPRSNSPLRFSQPTYTIQETSQRTSENPFVYREKSPIRPSNYRPHSIDRSPVRYSEKRRRSPSFETRRYSLSPVRRSSKYRSPSIDRSPLRYSDRKRRSPSYETRRYSLSPLRETRGYSLSPLRRSTNNGSLSTDRSPVRFSFKNRRSPSVERYDGLGGGLSLQKSSSSTKVFKTSSNKKVVVRKSKHRSRSRSPFEQVKPKKRSPSRSPIRRGRSRKRSLSRSRSPSQGGYFPNTYRSPSRDLSDFERRQYISESVTSSYSKKVTKEIYDILEDRRDSPPRTARESQANGDKEIRKTKSPSPKFFIDQKQSNLYSEISNGIDCLAILKALEKHDNIHLDSEEEVSLVMRVIEKLYNALRQYRVETAPKSLSSILASIDNKQLNTILETAEKIPPWKR